MALGDFANSTSGAVSSAKPMNPYSTDSLLIGNFLVTAPVGIAFIANNSAAFVVDTGGPFVAGIAAPDGSYNRQEFTLKGAKMRFEWGRVGDGVVARIHSDQPVELTLHLESGWPDWSSVFTPMADGVTGTAQTTNAHSVTRTITWRLRTSPAPTRVSDTQVVVSITPDKPALFVAGLGRLADFNAVDDILASAASLYLKKRPVASGDWGDFIGATADNMNNSRIYSSDNHMLAHSVSRAWAGGNPNHDPYFCWDSFFNANLASLDDLPTAENTVRAILSYQTQEGLVPNYAHANSGVSDDRSQPPVGSLCIWKIYQRWGNRDFLSEVYPKLVKWHDWWFKARDGNHNGLLEWGSATGVWQNAQYETGWDDNLHFAGTTMVGTHMDADAVDLNAMWAMDSEHLSYIADALGKKRDADRFRSEWREMNDRMNRMLWNEELGLYCSRLWEGEKLWAPVDGAAFGQGFEGVFYSDEDLRHEVVRRTVTSLNFNWRGKSPAPGVPGTHWSGRWTATFTPPETGDYRFITRSNHGIRLYIDGKKVIDDWVVQGAADHTANVKLTAGKPVEVRVEYFQHEGGSSLHLTVELAKNTTFLTRITPMNFYPLISGAADKERASKVMKVLTDPTKFWGTWVIPTLSYDDPNYHEQEYWRGDIWGPANYLIFQGLLRYATPEELDDFADKSVRLFMRNWIKFGVCGENYLSTDGTQSSTPHYTWGALLNLIGMESVFNILPDGSIWLNGVQTRTIAMRNIPIKGKLYEIRTSPGVAEILHLDKLVLSARNRVIVADRL
jgi:glycogen debranching enzyme